MYYNKNVSLNRSTFLCYNFSVNNSIHQKIDMLTDALQYIINKEGNLNFLNEHLRLLFKFS